jgi:hypothetical protein
VGGNLVEELLDAGHMVAQLVHWQDPVQNQIRLAAQTRGSYLNKAVLGIWLRIHIFLGLQDPDPLVTGTDLELDPAPDRSLCSQKVLSGLK